HRRDHASPRHARSDDQQGHLHRLQQLRPPLPVGQHRRSAVREPDAQPRDQPRNQVRSLPRPAAGAGVRAELPARIVRADLLQGSGDGEPDVVAVTAFAGLRPKRPDWFRGFLVVAVVSMVVYLVAAWWAPWTPGRLGGLTFGTLAALLFVVDSLYP